MCCASGSSAFSCPWNDLVTVFFQRFRTRRPAGQIRREIWPVIGTVDVNYQFLARDHIIRVPVVTDCQFNTCELEQFTCIQGIDPRTGFPFRGQRERIVSIRIDGQGSISRFKRAFMEIAVSILEAVNQMTGAIPIDRGDLESFLLPIVSPDSLLVLN